MLGNCKWFNVIRGYGFIKGKDDEDLFVHFTEINTNGYRWLLEGEPVEYDRKVTETGLQAVNVFRIDPLELPMSKVKDYMIGCNSPRYQDMKRSFLSFLD